MPKPTFAFTIPSIHDSTPLDCRIYLPNAFAEPTTASIFHESEQSQTSSSTRTDHQIRPYIKLKAAIVAHPYASLGGSYDDPVVSFVSKQLLSHGFVVGTFNFRGAPGSRGRTSWTGKPERADYISFVGFMTSYLRALTQSDTKIEDDSAAAAQESVQLVLGGYSYGSLIVTHLPPLDDMLLSFQDPAADTAASDIVQKSRYIAGETIPRNRRGVNPKSNGDGDEPAPATVGLNMHDFMVRYLLISPLLPPVSFFLNPSFGSVFGVFNRTAAPSSDTTLTNSSTLAVFGSEDVFTSASKMRTWAKKMQTASRGAFEWLEVDGASHFWREEGVEDEMRQRIARWVSH